MFSDEDAMAGVDQKIDQLLHDAEHAASGAAFAARMGHTAPANAMRQKARRLKCEAEKLYLDNPGSKWPDCEWPVPIPHERLVQQVLERALEWWDREGRNRFNGAPAWVFRARELAEFQPQASDDLYCPKCGGAKTASGQEWHAWNCPLSTPKSDSTGSTTQYNPNPDKLDSCRTSLD